MVELSCAGGRQASRKPIAWGAWRWLVFLTLTLGSLGSAQAEAMLNLRLRLAWGGGAESLWTGNISVSAGTLSNLKSLGMEPDTPGMLRLEGNQISIWAPSARRYQAVDLTVEAPSSAELLVEIARSDRRHELHNLRIPLQQLVNEPFSKPIDDQKNRLLIRRSPGDQLRVDFHREHLVLTPGETWKIDIFPNAISTNSDRLQLRAQLRPARSNRIVWRNSATLACEDEDRTAFQPLRDFVISTPLEEGVYDLMIYAVEPPRRTLRRSSTLAQRRLQFVVLDESSRLREPGYPAVEERTERTLFALNPSDSRWWNTLRSLSPLKGALRRFRMESGDMVPTVYRQRPVGELAVEASQSFSLPIDHPGERHRLYIECPAGVEQQLRITLAERGASGPASAIVDTVLISAPEMTENQQFASHEIVFWPRTRSVRMVLSNHSEHQPAQFATIRLAKQNPTGQAPAEDDAGPNDRPVPERDTHRSILATMTSPFFTAEFNASRGVDAVSGRQLTDWVTFYESAQRLVEYLRLGGYSGAALTVYGEGSTLYPSQLLDPTPSADSGAYFNEGHDPVRKDVVELLLRIFDREGLQLVPMLSFTTPLPTIEQSRINDSGTGPADLFSAEGLPWRRTRMPQGPYYDVTNREVQQAMADVVAEFAQRYHDHASLAGLGMELSADAYTLLPGTNWGYSAASVQRFLEEVKSEGQPQTQLPPRPDLVEQLIRGDLAQMWRHYRAQRVTQLYDQIARQLAQRGEAVPLYLLVGKLADQTPIVDALKPQLVSQSDVGKVMLEMGFSPAQLHDLPETTICRPMTRRLTTEWVARGQRAALASEGNIDRALETKRHRCISVHDDPLSVDSEAALLAQSRSASRGGLAELKLDRLPSFQFAGDLRRRELARALASFDARVILDGGDRTLPAESTEMCQFASVFAALPAAPFEKLEFEQPSPQHVVVRAHTDDRYRYVYVVNDAPWEVNVVIEFAGDTSEFAPLPAENESSLWEPSASGARWTLSLDPFSVSAARFAPGMRAVSIHTTLPEFVERTLKRRIAELISRASYFKQPLPMGWLKDPGFEQHTPIGSGAWTGSPESPGSVTSDDRMARNGQRSMRLTRVDDKYVWMRSSPIPAPRSGRMAVQLWARFDPRYPRTRLRIGVEGVHQGRPYYRFATVDPISSKNKGGWIPCMLRIDDLPTRQLEDLRIRFDMLTQGVVWIDDVSVFDRSFTVAEQQELAKIIALADLQLRDSRIRECYLTMSGYWPRYVEHVVPDAAARMATLPSTAGEANKRPARRQ